METPTIGDEYDAAPEALRRRAWKGSKDVDAARLRLTETFHDWLLAVRADPSTPCGPLTPDYFDRLCDSVAAWVIATSRHPEIVAATRRRTIAQAAVIVLRARETDMVVYGDCGLLDDIGHAANMKPMHPLNRHARILDALDRSPLFVKRFGRWSSSNRLVRGFQLRALTPNTPDGAQPCARSTTPSSAFSHTDARADRTPGEGT